MFRSILITVCMLAFAVTARGDADSPQKLTGSIEAVTVYQEQALITRHVKLDTAPNDQTLASVHVTNLPSSLINDSLYAEAGDGTTVRAVRVVTTAGRSDRSAVDELETAGKKITQQLAAKRMEIEVLDQQRLAMDRAFSFAVEKGNSDLNRGSLDVDALIQMSQYCDQQRQDQATTRLRIQNEIEELEQSLKLNQLRLDRLATSGTKTQSEAIVFIETKPRIAGEFRLRYRVSDCSWIPQYTFSGSRGSDQYEMRYDALVTQASGEDWNDAKLVLSTASATLDAAGPLLTPLRVHTSESENDLRFKTAESIKQQVQSLRDQQRGAESHSIYGGGGAFTTSVQHRDVTLNSLAAQMQRIELLATSDSARNLALDASESVSTQTYEIAAKVTLPSRRDQQLVQITHANLTGKMDHVATPLLSSYAYRQARLTNQTEMGLMKGKAMVYLDGRFVGQTDVPPTASGQRLIVGFGADQQIRTRRELLAKRDEIQGGNRQLEFEYRLVISNFKDHPVDVRVLDRLPMAKESQSVSLQLQPPRIALSEDALYLRLQRPQGILRWDVAVEPGKHGSNALDIEYQFSAAFDRNRQLTTEDIASVQDDYRMEQFGGMGGGGMGGFGN